MAQFLSSVLYVYEVKYGTSVFEENQTHASAVETGTILIVKLGANKEL